MNADALYKLYGRKLNGYKKGFIDGVKAYDEHQRKAGLDKIEERINNTIVGVDRHYIDTPLKFKRAGDWLEIKLAPRELKCV